ncbi:hypothetical protein ACQJBY_009240 [Aegilops geniculata]
MQDDGHPDPYLDLRPEIAEERRRAARFADERRRQHRETAPCLLSPPAPVAIDGDAHLVSFLDLHPELAEERRRPKPSSFHKTEVEEHASEVSSSEGSVTVDLSESTALALNDMPHTLQSTYWSNVCYDTGSSETESETVVGKPEEESDFDLCEVPDEEIIQNGKNWMTKEVMLAFEKYAERSTNLTGLDWQIEELCHQCFNVEYHHKVFHHYNFTVKIESPSSSDSRVALFFAEVKEIFGRKYYFCCPLEPNENGQCYACHNQGVDLRHPATGGYDRGSLDIAFPFTCMD